MSKSLNLLRQIVETEIKRAIPTANPMQTKLMATGAELLFETFERFERIEKKLDGIGARITRISRRTSGLSRASKQGKTGLHEKRKSTRKSHFKTI